MADLKLKSTGDGGELILQGNDIAMINGLQNMPYLATFGGNLEQSTSGAKPDGEQAFDYWANHLLMEQNEAIQFNSTLERRLKEVTINSSGRIQLERAIQADLAFMNEFAGITVAVAIVAPTRIEISIKIDQPDNLESNELVYIWDSTKEELTQQA